MSPEAKSLIPILPPNAHVLDLGCGNGILLTALPKKVYYTGLDFSQTMISEAQKLSAVKSRLAGQKVPEFILADILNPSVWNKLDNYDFIAALAVLHHLPSVNDHLKLLQNIKQHLSKNGTCLISVWLLDQTKLISFRINNHHLSIPFHGGPNRLFYAFTKNELISLAQKAGFSSIKSVSKGKNLYLSLKN